MPATATGSTTTRRTGTRHELLSGRFTGTATDRTITCRTITASRRGAASAVTAPPRSARPRATTPSPTTAVITGAAIMAGTLRTTAATPRPTAATRHTTVAITVGGTGNLPVRTVLHTTAGEDLRRWLFWAGPSHRG